MVGEPLRYERGSAGGSELSRIVCHFSCGAASAVATKLTLSRAPFDEVVIYSAFIVEENSDNRRFLADCEKWFAHPVVVLRDEKYGASAREVWGRVRFLKSRFGAPCSVKLKREVIEAACLPTDRHVYGFTWDERNKERVKRFLGVGGLCPLIDRQLTHGDCLAIIQDAGILLRYRKGWNNANCDGCPKGGEGYWNKVRREQPDVFLEVSKIEEELGPGAYIFRNRKTGERFPLSKLDPSSGRHDEPAPECSFFCAEIEEELSGTQG